jgi:hypothetical protein
VRAQISRGVLISPVAGRRIVSHTSFPNPLVLAVHLAFSRHLPLTISPDVVWLTIVQGFSHHVNKNAEALRGRLVRHKGRVEQAEQGAAVSPTISWCLTQRAPARS